MSQTNIIIGSLYDRDNDNNTPVSIFLTGTSLLLISI